MARPPQPVGGSVVLCIDVAMVCTLLKRTFDFAVKPWLKMEQPGITPKREIDTLVHLAKHVRVTSCLIKA